MTTGSDTCILLAYRITRYGTTLIFLNAVCNDELLNVGWVDRDSRCANRHKRSYSYSYRHKRSYSYRHKRSYSYRRRYSCRSCESLVLDHYICLQIRPSLRRPMYHICRRGKNRRSLRKNHLITVQEVHCWHEDGRTIQIECRLIASKFALERKHPRQSISAKKPVKRILSPSILADHSDRDIHERCHHIHGVIGIAWRKHYGVLIKLVAMRLVDHKELRKRHIFCILALVM
jgi:hypothetical protein